MNDEPIESFVRRSMNGVVCINWAVISNVNYGYGK